jgi:hypothetical protein
LKAYFIRRMRHESLGGGIGYADVAAFSGNKFSNLWKFSCGKPKMRRYSSRDEASQYWLT